MNEEIIALQETVAYQGREIEALSAELYRQQKELAALQIQLSALTAKLRTLEDSGADFGQEPPPPHY